MGTDLEDAEDLLRRQRARLDACVSIFVLITCSCVLAI